MRILRSCFGVGSEKESHRGDEEAACQGENQNLPQERLSKGGALLPGADDILIAGDEFQAAQKDEVA